MGTSTQMLRSTIAAAAVASAAAFSAPAALPGRVSTRAAVAKGPSMQLYRDGEIQGLGTYYIPNGEAGRPANLDGTLVGDVGFDPPGFEKQFGGAAMMKLHDLAVKQGAMQQLLLWLGLLELLSGVPAVIQTLKGSERMPGDFGFDPLGLGKDPNALARRQLVELKNGRLAMIAVGGMVHHYLLVGRGPIEFIKNIPNFKNPLPPF